MARAPRDELEAVTAASAVDYAEHVVCYQRSRDRDREAPTCARGAVGLVPRLPFVEHYWARLQTGQLEAWYPLRGCAKSESSERRSRDQLRCAAGVEKA